MGKKTSPKKDNQDKAKKSVVPETDQHPKKAKENETPKVQTIDPQALRQEELNQTTSPPASKSSSAELKILQDQIAEKESQALRARADLENFKRRKNQEVEEFKKYASESVIRDLLPILDSFDYACNHADANNPTKDMIEGFMLIQKQFQTVLEKLNIEPIKAENEPFDPNIHQAISQEESKDHKPDTVVKEVQKGYKYHEKVLRPSMVVVSK